MKYGSSADVSSADSYGIEKTQAALPQLQAALRAG